MFCSFLGIGQAGGNITNTAVNRGFFGAAINFSQKDLDSIEHVQLKLKLVGSEGLGKQREEAVRLMHNNWDLVSNFVKENFSHPSIEIIFVPFSTAGGSGSGSAPIILQLLQNTMPDKTFVAMPIIPSKNEVIANQKNCLDAFEDLSKLDICILPIDNDKYLSSTNNVARSRAYSIINDKVIQHIEDVTSYTEMSSHSSVLDRKDVLQLFKQKGITVISECNLMELTSQSYDLSQSGISNKIQNSWNDSPFTNVNFEQIISAGIIYDGQETLLNYINMNQIFSKFTNKMPINLYEGIYNTHKIGKVISILSGLSWINERLEQCDNIIEQNKDQIYAVYNGSNHYYQSKTNDLFNKPVKITPIKQHTVNDISDLINKFKR